jgi:formamidopyrimidine-DNA glycosylase
VPELPEVETVRRDLQAQLVGRRVEQATVTGRRTVRRQPPEELVARVQGARVAEVGRSAKYLLVGLDGGDLLVAHLRMSGQLRLHGPGDPLAPHTHARFALDDGRELRFVDPRTFGELFVARADELAALAPSVVEVGFDPLEAMVTPAELSRALSRRRVAVKGWLMDSRSVAGIGNIYSDEICHRAGVDPFRRTDTLSRVQVRRLHEAITTVIAQAVAARGSSLRDAQYVDLAGQSGTFQLAHRVYGREGLPCTTCGRPVRRRRFQQRSTFSCPRCQR